MVRNSKTKFIYPGANSNRGLVINSRMKKEERKWDAIENYVFRRGVLPFLKDSKHNVLLDVGAGTGVYIKKYGHFFKKIIAIEPDPARSAKISEDNKTGKNTTIINDFAENVDLSSNSVDVVFFIHVIQHISEEAENIILKKIEKAINKGGLLVLCFAQETRSHKGYSIVWKDKGDKVYFQKAPSEIFDIVVQKKMPRILPIRRINSKRITQKLKKMGYTIVFKEEYAAYLSSNTLFKAFKALINFLPVQYGHFILKKLKFANFQDCCIVAEKTKD